MSCSRLDRVDVETVLEKCSGDRLDVLERSVARPLWSHPLGRVFACADRMLTVLDPTVRVPAEGRVGDGAVRRLRGLRDAAILRVADIRWAPGDPLVLHTELVDAIPLAHRLGAGRLEPRRALEILRQVARALAAAHRAGVTHGALSTSSVLLGDDDTAWVADFGLGLFSWAEHSREPSAVPISPERTLGLPCGPSEDIYLFGCVAFAALAGSAVFEGGCAQTVRRRHAIEDPPSLHELPCGRDLSARVVDLVAACLAKESEDRFEDGGALEAALCDLEIVPSRSRSPSSATGAPPPVASVAPPPVAGAAASSGVRAPDAARLHRRRRWPVLVSLVAFAAGGWVAVHTARVASVRASAPSSDADAVPAAVTPRGDALAAPARDEPEPLVDGRESAAPVALGPPIALEHAAPDALPQTETRPPVPRDPPRSGRDPAPSRRRPSVGDLVLAARKARERGDGKEAEKLLRDALGRDPDHVPALEALGALRFNRGDYRAAVGLLTRAVRHAPRDSDLRIRLGDAHFKLAQWADARQHFAKAHDLGHPAAERRLSRTDEARGR